MVTLILKPGRERSLMRRHPWIFDTSVERIDGPVRNGDTVLVARHDGTPLARAGVSLASRIRARVWHFTPDSPVDHAFFRRRIAQAIARRLAHPLLRGQQGLRLVHGEADGLPGVILDRFGAVAVLQMTFAGAERWREAIVDAIRRALPELEALYERSDSGARRLEGLEPRSGLLFGTLPETVVIEEYGVRLLVDVVQGHKTGFYLDQRENRRLAGQLAEGARVLNAFCYSGGFSLHALAGGAREVCSIDSSGPALELARRNLALDAELPADRARWFEADVFTLLREWERDGERFDLVILDPPKFAPSAAHVPQARRAYRDVNLHGMRLVAPGGLLMTFSCSGGIGTEEFREIVAECAAKNGRDAQVLARLQAGPDHPVGLAVPESEYLKGLLVRLE